MVRAAASQYKIFLKKNTAVRPNKTTNKKKLILRPKS